MVYYCQGPSKSQGEYDRLNTSESLVMIASSVGRIESECPLTIHSVIFECGSCSLTLVAKDTSGQI